MSSVDDRTADFRELVQTLKMHESRHMDIHILIKLIVISTAFGSSNIGSFDWLSIA